MVCLSLSYRWEDAKDVEKLYEKYEKPIIVLYFGDCDKHGSDIYDSTIDDMNRRCNVEFAPIFCGLAYEQSQKYNLSENRERPEHYQWEALDDVAEKEIIISNIEQYVRMRAVEETQLRENKLDNWLDSFRDSIVKIWKDNGDDEDEETNDI
ncbi:MAG TPA: hypothetical protein VEG44_02660 [Candidatus Acidoferrales bacterium]|nr:hypothetical protein [Candidatus Acidoferrales bacterium]